MIVSKRFIHSNNNNNTNLRRNNINVDIMRKSKEDFATNTINELNIAKFSEITQEIQCILDFNGNIEYSNKAWETSVGWKSEDNLNFLQLIHSEDMNDISSMFLQSKDSRCFEVRIRCRNGNWERIKGRTKVVNGHIYVIARDITAQEDVEMLIKLKEDAERSAEGTKIFLANMSHEIRTPLNGVIGVAQLLEETDLRTEEQKAFVSIIKNSGKSLLAIVNDILDFSKIDYGKLELEELEFSITSVIEEVGEMHSIKAFKKGLELYIHSSASVPSVVGDAGRVRQLLSNLLSNAVKFTEKGHVYLRAEISDRINNTVFIKFTCSDTGIGIPDNKVRNLFTSFYQVDPSTTRKYGGTGLGLAICKGIAEQMGGNIEVESEEGKGTSFHCTLPFKATDIEETNGPKCAESVSCLIVDDNPIHLEILKDYITHFGCGFKAVDTSERAIKEIKESNVRYDIAIINNVLPDGTGENLVKSLLDLQRSPKYKMIMAPLTGSIKKFSGFVYLWKPIKKHHLLNHLSTALHPIVNSDGTPKSPVLSAKNSLNTQHKEPINVLVVDDNFYNLKVAEMLLNGLGLNCYKSGNGKEMLEITDTINFDLIFLDMHMPVMNGTTAAQLFRRREHDRGLLKPVPIIAMTAAASLQDKKSCLEAGMTDFISKPVQKRALAELLQKYIPRYTSELNPQSQVITSPLTTPVSTRKLESTLNQGLSKKAITSNTPYPAPLKEPEHRKSYQTMSNRIIMILFISLICNILSFYHITFKNTVY